MLISYCQELSIMLRQLSYHPTHGQWTNYDEVFIYFQIPINFKECSNLRCNVIVTIENDWSCMNIYS